MHQASSAVHSNHQSAQSRLDLQRHNLHPVALSVLRDSQRHLSWQLPKKLDLAVFALPLGWLSCWHKKLLLHWLFAFQQLQRQLRLIWLEHILIVVSAILLRLCLMKPACWCWHWRLDLRLDRPQLLVVVHLPDWLRCWLWRRWLLLQVGYF